MKVLIVYAHPNPQSFNHAVLEAFTEGLGKAGHTWEVADLHKEGFNPVLSFEELSRLMKAGKVEDDVRSYQQRVSNADGIVFIFPVWWASPPAILKGWIDRVFSMGFAYAFDAKTGRPKGLLKLKKAMIMNTAGATEGDARESGLGEALRKIHTEGILGFCGIPDVNHVVFHNVVMTSDEIRRDYLNQAREMGRVF